MTDFRTSLKDAELFRGLNDAALREITTAAATRCIAKDRVLFNQGDRPNHLFLVGQGKFKVASLGKDGNQRTLRFMSPGEIMGCAAVFNHFPYPATATATVESVVLSWTAAQFDLLLHKYPQLATNVLAIVGGRTSDILLRLHETASSTVEQRIARSIVRLAQQNSISDTESPLQLRLSRQDLAELSDTSLFTVSRTIAAWARARIVTSGRQRVIIRDLARLQQLAEIQD